MLTGAAVALTLLACWLAAPTAAATTLDSVRDLASRGRGEEALRTLEQLLAERPEDRDGLFLKGVLLVELRRPSEAEAVFMELVRRHPQLPEPYNNLAVLQAAGGRYDDAVDTLQQALETHASYETAYSNLTKIYSQFASNAYGRALSGDSVPATEVVELVLLGNIGSSTGAPPAVADPAPLTRVEEPLAQAPAADEIEEPPAAVPPAEPLPRTEPPPAEPVEQAEETPAAEEQPAVETEETGDDDLWATVDAWAAAWAGQQVDDYLSFYSSRFEPVGMSRTAWEQQRRARLTAPEYVRVRVAVREAERESPTAASVTFIQVYESNTFSDTVTKTLRLVREDGAWKILTETVGE